MPEVRIHDHGRIWSSGLDFELIECPKCGKEVPTADGAGVEG
jgi:hypothetical protein